MAPRIRQAVKKLPPYSIDQPPCPVKLNQNESPYDLPAALKSEVLARLAAIPWNRYPTPYADRLREKIAAFNRWSAEGVVVANGSNVLTQAIVAATAVGGTLLLPDPTFSLYELYGRLFGNKIFRVSLRSDFSLDAATFIRRIKRSRPDLIFLANPNAPTGRLIPPAELEGMIRASRGLVVVDEAYFPFSEESCLSLLPRYPQLAILRTFSKAFSLGGVRIGYLLAAPGLACEVRKVIPPFSVSAVSAAIAETLLENDRFVQERVAELNRERERIFAAVSPLPGLVVFPSRANFLLFRSPRAGAIYRGLIEAGVLVRNVSNKDRLKNCLRVTIGTPTENDRFLTALRKLVS